MKSIMFAALVAILALVWCGTAQAGTILLLTNTGWDGTTPGTAYLVNRPNPDQQFVDWVTNTLGHTVVKQFVSTATNQAQVQGWLNAISGDKMVVMGPRVTSGNYNNAKGMNQIATPMLALNGHVVRSSQLAWMNSTALNADNNATTNIGILAGQTGHPFFAGVASGAWFDYSDDGKGDTRGLGLAGDTATNLLGNGVILARGSAGAWNTWAEVVEWASGALPYAGGTAAGIFADRRVFMAMTNWSRVVGTDISDFTHDVTANGKLALANVINNMIPEPATMALLGLGLGAMLLRRRRK